MMFSRCATTAAVFFAALTASSAAQSMLGDAEAGLDFARTNCARCHAVEAPWAGLENDPPRDFSAIALDPSTTETSLRVFFRTPHIAMPNFALTAEQVDDLIAYFETLRSGGAAQ